MSSGSEVEWHVVGWEMICELSLGRYIESWSRSVQVWSRGSGVRRGGGESVGRKGESRDVWLLLMIVVLVWGVLLMEVWVMGRGRGVLVLLLLLLLHDVVDVV